jgi:hypothetical protein
MVVSRVALALKPCRTVITATSGGISGNTTLTVTGAVLQSFVVTPFNVSLPAGVSQQFKASGTFSDNSVQDITSQVTWASSQPTTATVGDAAGSVGLVVGATPEGDLHRQLATVPDVPGHMGVLQYCSRDHQ